MVPKNQKHILQNARSYSGTLVSSDHRLVVTKMSIKLYQVHKGNTQKNNMKKIDSYQLGKNSDKRNEYHRLIENYLNNIEIDQTAGERWYNVKEVIFRSHYRHPKHCRSTKGT